MNNEFIPYILAGYPNLVATQEILTHCYKKGIKYIELGIPFSDPSADGPIIQNAAEHASRKFIMNDCIAMLKDLKQSGVSLEITVMSYANPIYAYGIDRFLNAINGTDIKGLLIPDLPIEEHQLIKSLLNNNSQIKAVWMVSENLSDSDLKNITDKADYYLYLVSYIGTTGKNISKLSQIEQTIKRIKKFKNIPIVVGFGLKTRTDIQGMLKIANGAIIGTRIVEKLSEGIQETKEFINTLI